MKTKAKLTSILNVIEQKNVSVKLYIITRHFKKDVKKTARVIDKYRFVAQTVDLSSEVNAFFVGVAKNQIKRKLKDDSYELGEYTVIGDDLNDKLYTYALNNALSFSDVINNQMLSGKCSTLSSLSEIKNDLWAYSIRFSSGKNTIYTFRKASQGKIVTDKPRTKFEKLSARFDTSDAELKVALTETMNFDNNLDCIFADGEFLILRKAGFEQIVGLEQEFIKTASDVIKVIKKTKLIKGIELLETAIKEKRSLLKLLSNIAKKGTHSTFDSAEIMKMKDVLQQFEGKELNMSKKGKIKLESPEDVNYFIKLLNDFYKQGVVSGKFYGTNSGQVIGKNKA